MKGFKIFTLLLLVMAVLPLRNTDICAAADSNSYLWIKEYSSDDADSLPTKVLTDSRGYVYVGGTKRVRTAWPRYSFLTVQKYSPRGKLIWENQIQYVDDKPLLRMTLDASENLIVGGDANRNGRPENKLYKYAKSGDLLWSKEITLRQYSRLVDLATDQDNIYVLFHSSKKDREGPCIVKYDPHGNKIWQKTTWFPVEGGQYMTLVGLRVDADGDTYVGGTKGRDWGDRAMFVCKFGADGQPQWRRGCGKGEMKSIDVTSDGDICVGGDVYKSYYDLDFVTLKYNTDGKRQWRTVYRGQNNGDPDLLVAVVFDPRGNAYAGGISATREENGVAHYDFLLIKYDFEGNKLWVTRTNIHDDVFYWDEMKGMTVDQTGNAWAYGISHGDSCTVGYDPAGNIFFKKLHKSTGPNSLRDTAVSMATYQNEAYVLGSFEYTEAYSVAWTLIKYRW